MKKLIVFTGLMSVVMLAFSVQAQAQRIKPVSPACVEAEVLEQSFKSRNIIMNEAEAKKLRELKEECRESREQPK